MPHPPLIIVNVGDAGSESRLRQAIDNRNYVNVFIKGSKAGQLENALRRKGFFVPQGASRSIALAVLGFCLTALGMSMLLGVLIYAINQGYTSIAVNFRDRAGQNNDEFVIELR